MRQRMIRNYTERMRRRYWGMQHPPQWTESRDRLWNWIMGFRTFMHVKKKSQPAQSGGSSR